MTLFDALRPYSLLQLHCRGGFCRIEAGEFQRLYAGPAVALIGGPPFEQIQEIEPIHLVQAALHLQVRGQHGGELYDPEEVGYKPPKFAFDLQIMMLPDQGLILTFSDRDPEIKESDQFIECLKEMKRILQRTREKISGEGTVQSACTCHITTFL